MSTLQKKDACAQLFDLEKCFKKRRRKLLLCLYKNPSSFFILSIFYFYCMIALVYVVIDQGIHKGKIQTCSNALNEKQKKLLGFSFYINIANFEAFL